MFPHTSWLMFLKSLISKWKIILTHCNAIHCINIAKLTFYQPLDKEDHKVNVSPVNYDLNKASHQVREVPYSSVIQQNAACCLVTFPSKGLRFMQW